MRKKKKKHSKIVLVSGYYNHKWRKEVSKTKGKYKNDKSLTSDKERNELIKDVKRRGIDEIIKQNERIRNNLKCQV